MNLPWIWMAALAWIFLLFAGATACGTWVMQKNGLSSERGADRLVAAGIGLAVYSYLVFLLAAVHAASKPVLYGLTVLWGLWLIPGWLDVMRRESAPSTDAGRWLARLQNVSKPRLAVWMLFGVLALCNAIPALVPETGWDGMAYHLALPKIYLQNHGFVFRPDIFHNLFPQFSEMIYLGGLLFPYGIAAKGFHAVMGAFTFLILVRIGREADQAGAGLLAGLIFYAQYIVHMESTTAFIDLIAAAYAALALLLALRYARTGAFHWLGLAMFFLGVTAAGKWHGLVMVALALGVAAVSLWQDHRLTVSGKWRRIAQLAGWAGLPVLPYVLRAWIMGGNPFWPLFYRIFGGAQWDQGMADQIAKIHAAFAGHTPGMAGLVRLPYDLLVHGADFGLGGAELRWPLTGLLFTALCARLFLKRGTPGMPSATTGIVRGSIFLAVAGFVLIWFVSSPQIRFLLPLFPLAAWYAGRVLADLRHQPGLSLRLLALSISLLFFLFHPPFHRDTLMQANVLAGRTAPEAYCRQKIDHFSAIQFLNRHAKNGEKILLFGENRGFYLAPAYIWGDPVMQKVVDYRQAESPESLVQRLQALDIQWVLFRTDLYGEAHLPAAVVTRMRAALDMAGERAFEDGPVKVFRLHRASQLAHRPATGENAGE